MSQDKPVLPCPFCGHVGVSIKEGSTFRWVIAECDNCGATCGENRRNTMKPKDEAADREKALREWNTRALSALYRQGWISVEERLPEKNTTVLAWIGWTDVATFDPHVKRIKSQQWFSEPAGINPCFGITHWMPLPPAPHASAQINEPPQTGQGDQTSQGLSPAGPASGSPDEEV